MVTPSMMIEKEEEGPAREKEMDKEPKPAVLEADGQHCVTGMSGGKVKSPQEMRLESGEDGPQPAPWSWS